MISGLNPNFELSMSLEICLAIIISLSIPFLVLTVYCFDDFIFRRSAPAKVDRNVWSSDALPLQLDASHRGNTLHGGARS